MLTVAGKEILSTIRDRRAIVANLAIPLLLLPLVVLGLPLLLGGLFEREQEATTRIAVEGSELLPTALHDAIVGRRAQLVDTDDAAAAVRDDEVPAGLIVREDLAAALDRGEVPTLRLITKAGNLQGEVAVGKLRQAVEAYRSDLVASRLLDAGLDPSVLEPLDVRTLDASRPEERGGGQLAWLLPFFVAVWALAGGQMTALDATAGEKERGTLEALLVAPIRRSEVVAGKFLATLASGLSASLMAIVGVLAGGALLRAVFLPRLGGDANEMVRVMGGGFRLGPESSLVVLGSAVLLAAVVAALLIAVAMFARSFKEAQSYVAPMSLLMIVPAVALQFADLLDLGRGVYLVPVVNVMVLMDDVLGGSVRPGDVATSWAVMAALVAALLAFALHSFRREGVIFRT